MKIVLAIVFALILFGCSNNPSEKYFTKNENKYFEQIESNDIVLEQAKEGEWLYDHKEDGQTFMQFVASNTTKIIDSTSLIYLQPIGIFDSLQIKLIEITKEYITLFFQRKVEILPSLSDKNLPSFAKRVRETGQEQILASFILDSVLKHIKIRNSAALMALSQKDLFPNKDWSFVFGLASYHNRVGVTSIFRLQDKILVPKNFNKCLKRMINISSHEIGHMFSIKHCIKSKCVMNGSNSMRETDLGTNRLCSECQKKLCYSLKYNNEKRLFELHSFFKKYNLKYDYNYLTLDVQSL